MISWDYEKSCIWIGKAIWSPRDTLEDETKGRIALYIYIYIYMYIWLIKICNELLSFFMCVIVCFNSGIREIGILHFRAR